MLAVLAERTVMNSSTVMSLHSGGVDAFVHEGQPGPRCDKCGWLTDSTWVSPAFKLPPHSPDVAVTYDGAYILSEKFLVAVPEFEIFRPLPNDVGRYQMVPTQTVDWDEGAAPLRREGFCNECGLWQSVTTNGLFTYAIRSNDPGSIGIAKVSTELGWNDRRGAPIVINGGIAERLEQAGLTGLRLQQVMVFPALQSEG